MLVLLPGTQIDRYELITPIGEGGMAQVWVARQKGKHGFEKLFAWKCIHPRFADDPAFRRMFLDEARIASAIEHPNVAQVFDLGESGSMLYLVIEYVDGESLGALMSAASRRVNAAVLVPTGIALRIIADTCAGLHAAHSLKDANGELRGVVHRDISPQNILVSVRGDVKVIDFGIAHAKDRIGGDTQDGSLKGKIHYMAPEQALRQEIGPYTDVFAAGATLYRMLAGHPPFDGGNDAATIHRLVSGAAPPPLPDTVPPLIAAIVERALSFDPGDRYSSALAMQTAIEQAMVEEGFVENVAAWVTRNASDAVKERRAQLATRAVEISAPIPQPVAEAPSFIAELGPIPEHTVPRAPPPPPSGRGSPLAFDEDELKEPVQPVLRGGVAPVGKDTGGPGMLDVRALVARVQSPSAPDFRDDAPPPRRAPSSTPRASGGDEPPPSSHGAPVQAREVRHVGPATPARADNAGARAAGWIKLAVVAVVVVLAVMVVLLFLPRVVKDRVIASAREAGVELTIDRIGIGFGGVSLRGVTAKIAQVPGAELRADEVFATGFSARDVRVRGLDVKLEGSASDVGAALLKFYEQSRGRIAGEATEPRRIAIGGAHLEWTGLLGEGSRLDAGEVVFEIDSRGVGSEEIRTSVGRFDVKTKRAHFGPWAGSFERNATNTRLRLLLDPPVPDGPSALVVWGKSPTPRLTLKIPRSPLARLGIRPEELGLPADPGTEVEVRAESGQAPSMRNELAGRIDLFGLRLKSLKSPIDMKLEGNASGMPGKPLELEKTSLTFGPFVAGVTGTITPSEAGFRLDAAFRTAPIPCEKLARAEARSFGPIAAAIQDIAHATGAARVTGTAQGSGIVKYDTKAPDEATISFVGREACGLSLFGM